MPSGEKIVSTSSYVPENGARTGVLQPRRVARDISTTSCSPAKTLPTVHSARLRSGDSVRRDSQLLPGIEMTPGANTFGVGHLLPPANGGRGGGEQGGGEGQGEDCALHGQLLGVDAGRMARLRRAARKADVTNAPGGVTNAPDRGCNASPRW